MRRRRAWSASLVVAVLVAVVSPPSAQAASTSPFQRSELSPGLFHERYRAVTGGGPSDVNVLRLRLDDPRLHVTVELATGQVPGLETVPESLQRLDPRAVAGMNGGFFGRSCPTTRPVGDPCGLVIRDGLLASEEAANGTTWPGAFALFPPLGRDKPWAVDRPGFDASLTLPDGRTVNLAGVDRQPGGEEVNAFNRAYGPTTGTPAGTLEVVLPALELTPRTDTVAVVLATSHGGNSEIPASGTVLAARGAAAASLAGLRPGDPLRLRVHAVPPDWSGARQALAGGPLLIRDGVMTPPSAWRAEGFSPRWHNDLPHPRTVVAFTAAGELLLVTVDGRRRDSRGMTTLELAHLLLGLGSIDAVMMDGGGSTTMAARSQLLNVPCAGPSACGAPRPVASAIVVWSDGLLGLPVPEVEAASLR